MSTTETILSRAMNDAEFAELLLANPTEALAEYDLSAEELEKFEGMSRTDFEAFTSSFPEARKSMLSLNFTKIEFKDISTGSSTEK